VDTVNGRKLAIRARSDSTVAIIRGDVDHFSVDTDGRTSVCYGGRAAGGTIECSNVGRVYVETMDGRIAVTARSRSEITIAGGHATEITIEGDDSDFAYRGTVETTAIRSGHNLGCMFGEVIQSLTADGSYIVVTVVDGSTMHVDIDGVMLHHGGEILAGRIRLRKGVSCRALRIGPDVWVENAVFEGMILDGGELVNWHHPKSWPYTA
jgi:hypothetical protein